MFLAGGTLKSVDAILHLPYSPLFLTQRRSCQSASRFSSLCPNNVKIISHDTMVGKAIWVASSVNRISFCLAAEYLSLAPLIGNETASEVYANISLLTCFRAGNERMRFIETVGVEGRKCLTSDGWSRHKASQTFLSRFHCNSHFNSIVTRNANKVGLDSRCFFAIGLCRKDFTFKIFALTFSPLTS